MRNEINTTKTGGRRLRGLKARREGQGLSVKELSDASGVSEDAIRRFEAGEARANTPAISALANNLRCQPEGIEKEQAEGPFAGI